MSYVASLDERRLLRALRAGDEDALADLHARHHRHLVALAVRHGCSAAAAEDAAQETWAVVMHRIHRFQGRSTIKTWIFGILDNVARAHARRERKAVPVSAVDENVIDLAEARGRVAPPQPDELVVWRETLAELRGLLATLPPAQRRVLVLRDLKGMSAEEVCTHLGVSEGNQRVLLHRARARVRAGLESYGERESRAA